jgi:hypothetical protein
MKCYTANRFWYYADINPYAMSIYLSTGDVWQLYWSMAFSLCAHCMDLSVVVTGRLEERHRMMILAVPDIYSRWYQKFLGLVLPSLQQF